MRCNVEGLGVDDAFDGERTYRFTLRAAHELDAGHRGEVANLIHSWYTVGFYSGFGHSARQLEGPQFQRDGEGEKVTFTVIGAVTQHALDVLARCAEVGDHDVLFESLDVTVSEYDAAPPGARDS